MSLGQQRARTWIGQQSSRTHPLQAPASRKVFAMLVAYMDDSGTHDTSPNTVLAGYWGSVNEWRRFERAWRAVIDSEGIERFHAKEFWPRIPGKGRIGPYATWTDERHARFIDRLLKVIEETKITPFACGMLASEWEQLSAAHKQAMTSNSVERLQQRTLLPLHRILLRIPTYCHSHKVMHFVMELDCKKPAVQHGMLNAFGAVKHGLEQDCNPLAAHVGNLTFEKPKDATPLQAADLLAYEAHRYAKRVTETGDKNYSMRREYMRALRRFRSKHDFWLFDEPRFADLKRVLSDPLPPTE